MVTEKPKQRKYKRTLKVLAALTGVFLLIGCCGVGGLMFLDDDESMPTPTVVATTAVTAIPSHTPTPTLAPIEIPTTTPRPIWTPHPTYTPQPLNERITAQVTEVVDGDTIKVEIGGTIYTVRYIGIDTPETVHPSKPVQWMGPEASEANRQLVGGQTVYLEKDVSETDRYGRLLCYVFLADGLFVNAELVRLGYAQVSTYPPDVRYQDLFLEVQREAREADRGLWGPTPTPRPVPTVTVIPLTATLLSPKTPAATATSAPVLPTDTPQPAEPNPVCDCSGNIYNCPDFTTQAQAQACHDYCMAQGRGDVHKLDADDDGVACESLP